ncbi:type I-B CRISPR-associated protein Cas7/Cst2/DevR [Rhodocaloribacter litoris]|uniref:type I-B CRISPR-associated protein Cas7/Cst2/DevR n=1 Tax=Rhodocaloribacter litoris TaxID=2558931 RepID=UPI0014218BA9|nr:type I-B CRISPR-associated protein Cas7/Cst2/DevR [Rhodocaloribacter litoris]QXD14022.1 type I-B CRISPR-associated protein Cas7/Cst2/DevR [Rhodocaloribacter litoris]
MAFIAGIQVIHAPASALNNAGMQPGNTTENAVVVKALRINGRSYPYVSAQAYRYWLRRTLEQLQPEGWTVAPIFREKKVAYTDANPIEYADDDVFGYMRAPGKSVEAADSRAAFADATETKETVTRVSPFRVGTLVAISDELVQDFGTMSRHEGDPVPHEHQFYRTSLKGMFSIDLGQIGVFTYENRTGFLNLDEVRRQLAETRGLAHDEANRAYRLPDEVRLQRIRALLSAMPVVDGGAKHALHYTDVNPVVVIMAVVRGGNNPFYYTIDGDRQGLARPVLEAFQEIGEVWGDQILSPLYIGWVEGYASEGRQELEQNLETLQQAYPHGVVLGHPRRVFARLAEELERHPEWLA